jgi:hypothetical protein
MFFRAFPVNSLNSMTEPECPNCAQLQIALTNANEDMAMWQAKYMAIQREGIELYEEYQQLSRKLKLLHKAKNPGLLTIENAKQDK